MKLLLAVLAVAASVVVFTAVYLGWLAVDVWRGFRR